MSRDFLCLFMFVIAMTTAASSGNKNNWLLYYPTVLISVSHALKDHLGGQSTHWGNLFDTWLQQQVGILPIDLFPGDSREEGPVCSVSCGEAVARKQYLTSSFAVTIERAAPVSVLITFSLRSGQMKAQPIRSQLLFCSFIFANEIMFSWGSLSFLAAIAIPSEFGPYCIPQTSLCSPGMTT